MAPESWDMVQLLPPDLAASVLSRLDGPADLARAAAVSPSWLGFVIVNGLCKKLCVRLCSELSGFPMVNVTARSSRNRRIDVGISAAWDHLEEEHKAYCFLNGLIASSAGNGNCIAEAIGPSTTDRYPDESIVNTLVPRAYSRFRDPSYWSSKGSEGPYEPETLTYNLHSSLSVVYAIKIWPFRDLFEYGEPIYSARFVRFRMGYSRLPPDEMRNKGYKLSSSPKSSDDIYTWTYVSPEFPMAQENKLQVFELPRAVVCTGGVVQIELSGRIIKHYIDGLYYFCICYVEVIGRSLSPAFDLKAEGAKMLKYCQNEGTHHDAGGKAAIHYMSRKR